MMQVLVASMLAQALQCLGATDLRLVQLRADRLVAAAAPARYDAKAEMGAFASANQGASKLALRVLKGVVSSVGDRPGQAGEIVVEDVVMRWPVAARAALFQRLASTRVLYQRKNGIISVMSAADAARETKCDQAEASSGNAKTQSSQRATQQHKKQKKQHRKTSLLEVSKSISKASSDSVSESISDIATMNISAEFQRKIDFKAAWKAKKAEEARLEAVRAEEQQRLDALRAKANKIELTAHGYNKILAGNDSTAMTAFVKRLMEKEGYSLVNEPRANGELQALVHHYSGACANGTYDNLLAELYEASLPSACTWEPWVEKTSSEAGSNTLMSRWLGADSRLPTWHWRRAMNLKARRAMERKEKERKEKERKAGHLFQTSSVPLVDKLKGIFFTASSGSRSPGGTAPLSNDGYTAVLSTGDAAEMQTFVQRVLQQQGLKVVDPEALTQMMPFYDGLCASHSYDVLVRELNRGLSSTMCGKAWVAPAH